MMLGNPFVIPDVALLAAKMTLDEQVAAASHAAEQYWRLTGAPLMVGPNQMKFFREAGVDCSHLLEYELLA